MPLPNIFLTRLFFKNKIEKEALPRDSRLAWAQGAEFKSRRPDHLLCFNSLFLMLQRQKLGSKYTLLHAFYCTTLLFWNRVQINFARDLRCGVPRTVPASPLECRRYQASARGCALNAAFAVIGNAYCGRTPLRRRGIGRYSTVGWCRTGADRGSSNPETRPEYCSLSEGRNSWPLEGNGMVVCPGSLGQKSGKFL